MALALYYVLRGGDRWIVRLDERDYGHDSLTSALKAAFAAAGASAADGHEVQVLVQRPDGSWEVSWTSEDSPAA
ncbi:MAG: hypothetical protein E6G94_15695 [Alphaproteobacteria bacterium]|nr:MAG: hypothetical protein E6G94_15695 [Alphaproteobacteria bacterium]